jgi:hypothetical protein
MSTSLITRDFVIAQRVNVNADWYYTVVGGGFEHHGASMQVVAEDDGTCRFVWACDVLPNAAADRIRPLMDAGVAALKRTFEQG